MELDSIFGKPTSRILDPYAKRERVVYLNVSERHAKPAPRGFEAPIVSREEGEQSPLDDFIQGFARDLKVNDTVEIVPKTPAVVPEAEKEEKKPEAAEPEPGPARKGRVRKFPGEMPEPRAPAGPPVPWTNETFWQWIKSLGWCDRSDGDQTRFTQGALKCLDDDSLNYMRGIFAQLYESMKTRLTELLDSYDVSPQERVAIISHVIAKGEEFYTVTVDDPDFVRYMIDAKDYIDFAKVIGFVPN